MTTATTLNLASVIAHHAKLTPRREAVVWENVRLTYDELEGFSNRVANALVKMGIGYDDKVALVCPNLPFFPIVYYGIMKAGAVAVPLNVLFTAREFIYHLGDSDAKAVFVFEGTEDLHLAATVKEAFDETPACEHLVVMTRNLMGGGPITGHPTLTELTMDQPETFDIFPTRPDDTCSILYTSGTTGQPKGAELTHFNIYMNSVVAHSLHLPAIDFTSGEEQTCLITLPLFHTTGQTVQMNAMMYGGGRVVLLPRFDSAAPHQPMARENVNIMIGVATI
jgi:long-chain acyl-CoA synthetase